MQDEKSNLFQPSTPKKPIALPEKEPLHPTDIISGFIVERMIEDMVIKRGLVADLPDGSTHTTAYFATDSDTLYIWNGVSWVSTTLT